MRLAVIRMQKVTQLKLWVYQHMLKVRQPERKATIHTQKDMVVCLRVRMLMLKDIILGLIVKILMLKDKKHSLIMRAHTLKVFILLQMV